MDRARWRFTGNRRVLPTLSVGLEFNPGESEIGPLLTWFVLSETERRPGVFLGTSSDRIGTGKGDQAYYLTLAKAWPAGRVSLYAGVSYSENAEAFGVPFGGTLHLPGGVGLRAMYDGEEAHLLASWGRGFWSASLMWIWLERPGVAVSVGF